MRSLSAWWMRDAGRKLTTSRIENFHLPTQNAEEPLILLDAPLVGVFGNNDGDRLFLTERFRKIGNLYPDFHEFTAAVKRCVLMHEPKFIDALVVSCRYDLVIYGHTHAIGLREGKTLVINPGECGGWLTGRATVVILKTDDMSVRLIDL